MSEASPIRIPVLIRISINARSRVDFQNCVDVFEVLSLLSIVDNNLRLSFTESVLGSFFSFLNLNVCCKLITVNVFLFCQKIKKFNQNSNEKIYIQHFRFC